MHSLILFKICISFLDRHVSWIVSHKLTWSGVFFWPLCMAVKKIWKITSILRSIGSDFCRYGNIALKNVVQAMAWFSVNLLKKIDIQAFVGTEI